MSRTEMFFSEAILRKSSPELTYLRSSSAQRERERVEVPVPGDPLIVIIICDNPLSHELMLPMSRALRMIWDTGREQTKYQ